VILGFKVCKYILDPKVYGKTDQVRKFLIDNVEGLRQYISIVIKEVLRTPLLKTDFITELSNFYKSDDKELCNDQIQVIWSKEYTDLYTTGRNISNVL
jgi:hypothetical protein